MSDQYVPPNPQGTTPRATPYRDPASTERAPKTVIRDTGSGFGMGAMVGVVFVVVAILAAVFYGGRDTTVPPADVVTDPVAVPQTGDNAETGGTAVQTAPDAAVPADDSVVTPDTVAPDAAAPDATAPDAAAPDAATGGGTVAPANPPAATTQP